MLQSQDLLIVQTLKQNLQIRCDCLNLVVTQDDLQVGPVGMNPL